MSFFKRIINWLEYGSAKLITDFGRLYSGRLGNEAFTVDAKLMREGELWILRLDLRRQWGNTGNREVVDCYFKELEEIKKPFNELLNDVNAGAMETNIAIGLVTKMLTGISAGEIIRGYGRIDNHPRNDSRFHTELFLSQNASQYWLLLSVGKGSVEWSKWPIDAGEAIYQLLEQIKKTMEKSTQVSKNFTGSSGVENNSKN